MADNTNDKNQSYEKMDRGHMNPDPITKEPGAHPVGAGVGAAVGGAAGIGAAVAAGAAAGSAAGPVGTAVGAAIGAVVGGLAGKGVAETVNPTAEATYWRDNFSSRPYAKDASASYDDYAPAYQYGWESKSRSPDRSFDDAETDLKQGWDKVKDKSRIGWDKAKHATRDAWHRIEQGVTGDSAGTSGSDTVIVDNRKNSR